MMATRYAGKYRRNPYPQATRMKNILTSYGTYHWGRTFWHPPRTNFLFLRGGGRLFLQGKTCPPPPTSHTASVVGRNAGTLQLKTLRAWSSSNLSSLCNASTCTHFGAHALKILSSWVMCSEFWAHEFKMSSYFVSPCLQNTVWFSLAVDSTLNLRLLA